MKKFILVTTLFSLFVGVFSQPILVLADPLGVEIIEANTELGKRDLLDSVAGVIDVFLGLVGTISLIIIIYAGFMWMTSGGSEEKIGKAKKMLLAGVIGLLIILAAYIISKFVFSALYKATAGTGGYF